MSRIGVCISNVKPVGLVAVTLGTTRENLSDMNEVEEFTGV